MNPQQSMFTDKLIYSINAHPLALKNLPHVHLAPPELQTTLS